MVIKLEDADIPIWTRMAARKGGLRGSGVTYTKSYLDRQTQTIVELIHEWSAMRSHWRSAVEAIRSADADEWLGRAPNRRDHLTLQLQSIRDSQKATRKPKRQTKPKRQA